MQHRPRRIVIALLIASLSAAGVLASGAVIEAADVPATFSTPIPRAGDSGRYDMSLIDGSGDAPVVAATVPYLRFETQYTSLVDTWGRGHVALEQRFQRAGWEDIGDSYGWAWGWPQSLIYDLDHTQGWATDRIRSSGWIGEVDTLTGSEEVDVDGFVFWRTYHWPNAEFDGIVAGGHCFLNHGLQGRRVDTVAATELFNECDFWWPHLEPGRLSGYNYTESRVLGGGGFGEYISEPYQALGATVLDGHDVIVFASPETGATFWFREELAYPVRVTHPGSDGYALVFTLAEFQQGGAASPPAAAQDAPPWAWRATRPWGPDDTAWQYWSPRDAWQTATADLEVARFLEDHPDARNVYADWTARDDEDREAWVFRLMEGDAGLEVIATREMGPQEAGGPANTLLASLTDQTEVATESIDFTNATMRDIPRVIPSAASLAARVEAYTGQVPDHLTWYFGYPYNDGFYGAYRHYQEGVDPTTGSLEAQQDLSDLGVGFDDQGHAWSLHHLEFHEDPEDPLLSARPAPTEALQEVPAAPGVHLPLQVVAGAGLLAGVAAVIYYFGPALKSGAVGLFSRIQGDAVLSHPMRRQLHQLVQENPGAHANELHRIMGGGYGALDHHLQRLLTAGKITSFSAGGYTCFFPKKTDRRLLPAAPALRHDSARAVLGAVMQQPGINGSALAGQLDIGRATVIHHLKRLQDAGLVDAVRDGRSVQMFPTDIAHLARRAGMAS